MQMGSDSSAVFPIVFSERGGFESKYRASLKEPVQVGEIGQKSCVLFVYCRQENAVFSLHIHTTWEGSLSAALYVNCSSFSILVFTTCTLGNDLANPRLVSLLERRREMHT